MSKYDPLWARLAENGSASITLTYDEIAALAGVPLDHSFLTYKKEAIGYGYKVVKISMKNKTVAFEKIAD